MFVIEGIEMIDTNLELNNEENSSNEASTSHNSLSQTSICTFSLFFLTQNWINAPNHHFMTVNWQVYGKLMLTTDFLLISKRQMYIILVCNCIKNAIQQKKVFPYMQSYIEKIHFILYKFPLFSVYFSTKQP